MKRVYLLILGLTLLGCGLALRFTYASTAESLGRAIEQDDAKGVDVQPRLQQLRDFAASHAGAGVTVELKGSYERAVQDAAAQNARSVQVAEVYRQAQGACGGRRDARQQAACVQQYVSLRLTSAEAATPVSPPDPASFRYRLASPFWAPDIAGVLQAAGLGLTLFWMVGAYIRRRRRASFTFPVK